MYQLFDEDIKQESVKLEGYSPGYCVYDNKNIDLESVLQCIQYDNVSSKTAYRFYQREPFLASIVNMLSRDVSQVKFRESKGKKRGGITLTPIPDSMKEAFSQNFINDLVRDWMLTGGMLIKVIGVNKPALIERLDPRNVSYGGGNGAGPYTITDNLHEDTYEYDSVDRVYRTNGLKEGLIELYQVANDYEINTNIPMSFLTPLTTVLSTRILGWEYNKQVIERGGSMAGWFNLGDEADTGQIKQFTNTVKNRYSGSTGAGTNIITAGKDITYQAIGQSNKDLAFPLLLEATADSITSTYGIPIAAISSKAQTLSNAQTAKGTYTEQAILPVVHKLLIPLSVIAKRFKIDNLVYDPRSFEVLQTKKYDDAQKASMSASLTVNEIRAISGHSPIAGGDVLAAGAGTGSSSTQQSNTNNQKPNNGRPQGRTDSTQSRST